jgi:peptidyl-prolyl cis-trans isomerase SurA
MSKFALIAALLAAPALLAQDKPAQSPPPQPPPAQNPPAQNPPAQNPPMLEKPQMAEPEPAEELKKTPAPPPKVVKKPTEGTKVVEEIIARVNNEIITRSELEKARASELEDAQENCKGRCTPDQLQAAQEDAQKFALRNLIDQSLLAQRGKDMSISVEADVVKQLDQIRQQNKLKDLDELEKAVTTQGMNWDDFKGNIRNHLLTREVIGREVGSHITISNEETKKYYDEHQKDFIRPETIALAAIEIKTEGKKESEIPELKAKAQKLHDRVGEGEDFSELAKHFSEGATAQQGGYLGEYKHSELASELWDKVDKLKRKQITEVIETKQSFLILQVLEHFDEGQQPFEKVSEEIRNRLYSEKMEPALREYLKTLREQSYVVIKPGFQDMAGGGNSEIQEVNATPENSKSKKGRKKFLLFGKRGGKSEQSGSGAEKAAQPGTAKTNPAESYH